MGEIFRELCEAARIPGHEVCEFCGGTGAGGGTHEFCDPCAGLGLKPHNSPKYRRAVEAREAIEREALARGIEPEGRESEGPRAKPKEPGPEGTRPEPPPVREMTDDEILDLWQPHPGGEVRRPVLGKNKVLAFARAVLLAAGAKR